MTLMAMASCQSFYDPIDGLCGHENPTVSVPACIGAWAMGVVGVPIAIAVLPASGIVSAECDANLGPLSPVFAVAQVGAIALGGLPWLLLD